jgi:hypothetical protein
MGYALTTIVCFGVEISSDEAEKIYGEIDRLYNTDSDWEMEPNEFIEANDYTVLPANSGYVDGIEGGTPTMERYVHEAQLLSHDTDMRIHSLYFEKGRQHSFGAYCGSKGYAYHDEVSKIMRSPPADRAAANFKKYCAPILATLGIEGEPELHLVMQTW